MIDSPNDGFGASVGADLVVDVAQVEAHGAFADVQLGADALIVPAAAGRRSTVALTLRQFGGRAAGRTAQAASLVTTAALRRLHGRAARTAATMTAGASSFNT
ncbi:hypothetical protein [Candidatus Amarobacter glycogenicus]|uniref:hypothetical protein n=1 Tax=Candidatus Amarobacter glycogenicus TaxID=3140699 RepID=UPI0031CC8378